MKTWYYLAGDGSLLCSNDLAKLQEDFRYGDIQAYWFLDTEYRETAWRLLVEAVALGADMGQVRELAALWGCTDEDADIYAKKISVELQIDGNAWCATPPGFVNPAESSIGYGDTKLEALASLATDMGFVKPCKVWGAHFDDLLGAALGHPAD